MSWVRSVTHVSGLDPDGLAVCAVMCEPVSASKMGELRELTGQICEFRPFLQAAG
jgi:hypothetical protein